MSWFKKLTVAFAATVGIGGVGVSGYGLYEAHTTLKDDYVRAATCEKKIATNQSCTLEEQKSLVKRDQNDALMNEGVLITWIGIATL